MNIKVVFCILVGFIISTGALTWAEDSNCHTVRELFTMAIKTVDLTMAKGFYLEALSTKCGDSKLLGYIHNNLGDIAEQKGDLQAALGEYKKAEYYLPKNEIILEEIAALYQRLDRHQEAVSYYDRLYRLKGNVSSRQIVERLNLRSHLRSVYTVPVSSHEKPEPLISLPSATLYFDLDSSQLRRDTVARLNTLRKALDDPSILDHRFLLAGHTCSLGTEDYNMGLSIRRAKRVRDWLVANGISPDRLVVKGYGESRPIMSNRWEYTRRFNRRVEITTIGIEPHVTREVLSPRQKHALILMKTGQDLIARGDCYSAIRYLEQAVKLVSANTDLTRTARENLILGYMCTGNLEKVRALQADE